MVEHRPITKPCAGLVSHYAATANLAPENPEMLGRHKCDIAIVGAGFTGLSAADCAIGSVCRWPMSGQDYRGAGILPREDGEKGT